MIIIEGPDGVGKTTLSKRLSKDLGVPLAPKKHVEAPKDPRTYTYKALGPAVTGEGDPLIWDRLFFSELVYGTIVRDGPALSMPEQAYVMRVLKTLGCPVIFCSAPADVIDKNVKRSKQMRGVKRNLTKIVDAYRYYAQFAKQQRLNVYYFDYIQFRSKHYIHLTHQLQAYLDLRRVRTWH